MTARKTVQLSEQALMRILKAAIQEERIKAIRDKRILKAMSEGRGRRKVHGWPADQTPSDLRRELLKVISEYSLLRHDKAEAKARWGRLKAIHKHASALSKLLAADEENQGEFTEHWRPLWPQDMPAASELVNKMRELVEESGWLKASPQNIAAETKAHYVRLTSVHLIGWSEQGFRQYTKIFFVNPRPLTGKARIWIFVCKSLPSSRSRMMASPIRGGA
jgi:hypothetical protein